MDFAQDQFKTHHHNLKQPPLAAAAAIKPTADLSQQVHPLNNNSNTENSNSNTSGNSHKLQHHQQYSHKLHHYNNDKKCLHSTGFKLFVGEFIGTFVFVFLGQSALSSFELIGTQNDIINRQLATLLTSACAYLLATLLTISLTGAHLNPAFTLASASYGYTKWRRASTYVCAQYLGSFLAAIFIHATYSDKLNQRHSEGLLVGMNATLRAHGNILSTGKLFTSYPPTEVSLTQLSISCTLASALLMLLLLSVQQSKLVGIPRFIRPIFMAAALFLVQAAFMANGGPVLNPAQDFSPRLYIAMFGWGLSAFNLYHYNYWWICGLLAPHLGALIGFAIYQVLAHIKGIHDYNRDELDDIGTRYRENEF